MPTITTHKRTFASLLLLSLGVWSLAGIAETQQSEVQNIASLAVVNAANMDEQVQTELPVLQRYIEIVGSCGPHFDGECVNVRSGPGLEYPVVATLRNGVVLKVQNIVSADGHAWYHVWFDEGIRYPERHTSEWYVASEYGRHVYDTGDQILDAATPTTTKRIIVDRSEQMLYAYEVDTLFMKLSISTGLELTPTPRGLFTVFKKTPSRYMQGPLPGISDQYYDLPGVPWNLYFTREGAVIHGAYWHNSFGQKWSHGCVNLPLAQAEELYTWADVGTSVLVRD